MSISGCIFTNKGWVSGTVDFDHKITAVRGHVIDFDGYGGDTLIIPGFIDLHVHGGNGADVMQGTDAVLTMAKYHATQGTVAMTPTTMTAPTEDITHTVQGVAQAIQRQSQSRLPPSADILGVHLEGPFISPDKLGAQPDYAIDANITLFQTWHNICPIKIMTMAPEIPHAKYLAQYAYKTAGTRVQIGHTIAEYECCKHALSGGGFSGATHLYNAMSGLLHRQSGAVAGILSHSNYAEIIPDMHHVDAGAIRSACRAIPYVYAVTDATAAAGQADGEYILGNHKVYKQNGTIRLCQDNTTLAGSSLTMIQAFKNWIKLGETVTQAIRRTSTYPAQYLGMRDAYGSVDTGLHASFLILNKKYDLQHIYIHGQMVL